MKMTEKTKRRLAVGGGIAICAGLIAAISLQFVKPPAEEDVFPVQGSSGAEVTVTPAPVIESGDDDSTELSIQPLPTETPLPTEAPVPTETPALTETPAPTETPVPTEAPAPTETPVLTDPPVQNIQPEVEKPQQSDEKPLDDPERKPDGTKVEGTPKPEDHDTYVPPADDGGESSGGGLPGFDNVPNLGANTAIQAGDMYENGNKIGSMD